MKEKLVRGLKWFGMRFTPFFLRVSAWAFVVGNHQLYSVGWGFWLAVVWMFILDLIVNSVMNPRLVATFVSVVATVAIALFANAAVLGVNATSAGVTVIILMMSDGILVALVKMLSQVFVDHGRQEEIVSV